MVGVVGAVVVGVVGAVVVGVVGVVVAMGAASMVVALMLGEAPFSGRLGELTTPSTDDTMYMPLDNP